MKECLLDLFEPRFRFEAIFNTHLFILFPILILFSVTLTKGWKHKGNCYNVNRFDYYIMNLDSIDLICTQWPYYETKVVFISKQLFKIIKHLFSLVFIQCTFDIFCCTLVILLELASIFVQDQHLLFLYKDLEFVYFFLIKPLLSLKQLLSLVLRHSFYKL